LNDQLDILFWPRPDPNPRSESEISARVTPAEQWWVNSRERSRPDPDHSEEEERFLILGLSGSMRILMVCHCYREEEQVIRIISARKASKSERRQYEERWTP